MSSPPPHGKRKRGGPIDSSAAGIPTLPFKIPKISRTTLWEYLLKSGASELERGSSPSFMLDTVSLVGFLKEVILQFLNREKDVQQHAIDPDRMRLFLSIPRVERVIERVIERFKFSANEARRLLDVLPAEILPQSIFEALSASEEEEEGRLCLFDRLMSWARAVLRRELVKEDLDQLLQPQHYSPPVRIVLRAISCTSSLPIHLPLLNFILDHFGDKIEDASWIPLSGALFGPLRHATRIEEAVDLHRVLAWVQCAIGDKTATVSSEWAIDLVEDILCYVPRMGESVLTFFGKDGGVDFGSDEAGLRVIDLRDMDLVVLMRSSKLQFFEGAKTQDRLDEGGSGFISDVRAYLESLSVGPKSARH